MRQHHHMEKVIDQAIGRRILSSCWLLAGLGCSLFQMLLLAQAWSLHQQAFLPACLASAWVLGGVLGMRLRVDARFLGMSVVLCALFWLVGTRFISWQTTSQLLPMEVVHLSSLIAFVLLLGAISTAWLSQQRFWSPAGEQVTLSRALVGTTAGLFLVGCSLPGQDCLDCLVCCHCWYLTLGLPGVLLNLKKRVWSRPGLPGTGVQRTANYACRRQRCP